MDVVDSRRESNDHAVFDCNSNVMSWVFKKLSGKF